MSQTHLASLGIDVAKATFDAALLRDGKLAQRTFAMDPEGFAAVDRWIREQGAEQAMRAPAKDEEAYCRWPCTTIPTPTSHPITCSTRAPPFLEHTPSFDSEQTVPFRNHFSLSRLDWLNRN